MAGFWCLLVVLVNIEHISNLVLVLLLLTLVKASCYLVEHPYACDSKLLWFVFRIKLMSSALINIVIITLNNCYKLPEPVTTKQNEKNSLVASFSFLGIILMLLVCFWVKSEKKSIFSVLYPLNELVKQICFPPFIWYLVMVRLSFASC